jgi:hypothetical protein
MPSVTVKFKSNKAAEEFAADFSILRDKAVVEIHESTAVISSDDPKALRFVKKTADDMMEDVRCLAYAHRLLSAITECISTEKNATVSLMDSTEQSINIGHALALASMHDRLNEENQAAFLVLASESKDAYAHAVNFARANEEMI